MPQLTLLSINPLNILLDKVMEWFKGIILDMAIGYYKIFFEGVKAMFDTSLILDIGSTPFDYNTGVYNLIKELSNNFVLPIAIVFMSFFLVYELVNTVLNENKMSDNNAELIIKWLFKYTISTLLISYAFEILDLIFILGANAAEGALNALTGNDPSTVLNSIDIDLLAENAKAQLMENSLGDVFIFWFISLLVSLFAQLLQPLAWMIIVCRFVMIYIYMITAPLNITTLPLKGEWGQIGSNYVRSMIAFAIQALLIVAIFAIFYGSLANVFVSSGDLQDMSLKLFFTVIMLFLALFKSESIAKSIMNAH